MGGGERGKLGARNREKGKRGALQEKREKDGASFVIQFNRRPDRAHARTHGTTRNDTPQPPIISFVCYYQEVFQLYGFGDFMALIGKLIAVIG